MAYAAKHQGTFEGPSGYTYRVSVEVDGFVGSAAALTFGGNGHTRVQWNPVDGTDEMGPLQVSECFVRIHDPNFTVMADVGPATRLRIEQDKNDAAGYSTYWLGHTSTLTKRSANRFASEVEIHAIDGLGKLKSTNYQDVFASSGRITAAEAIHKILAELGYGFSVATASNWYSYRNGAQLTAADNPLEDRTLQNTHFYTDTSRIPRLLRRGVRLIDFDGTWNLYDVLQQILNAEGLTLYQRPGGIWDVVQRELLESGSYGIWTYPSTWGAGTKTTRSTDHTVSEQYLSRNEGGEWDKAEAYRTASLAYEHGKIGDEVLDNPKFTGISSAGTALSAGVATDWTKVLVHQTGPGSNLFDGRKTQGINPYVTADFYTEDQVKTTSDRVLETTGVQLASGSGPLSITFNIWGPNHWVPIEVKVGSYWINEDGNASNTGTAEDHLILAILRDTDGWRTVTVTIPTVPATDEIYIALWVPVEYDPNADIAGGVAVEFGAIKIDYAEDGSSDKDRTLTVGTGSTSARGSRPGHTLYLGSGPIASMPGCVLDGLGGIATGFDRGPVSADSGVSMHQMIVQSYVQQRFAGRDRHSGHYYCDDGMLLTPFEIWQTPVIDSNRVGLVSFERVLDTEECIIREGIVTTVSGVVTFSSTGTDAESTAGGSGAFGGGASSANVSGEIARRVGEILLTTTSAAVASGAQTTAPINAYGGSQTRLFNGDPVILTASDTGIKYELTLSADVGPAATSISFSSYTFPREIPSGSAIKLDMRRLMESALRGGGRVDGGPLNVGTPTTAETVAGRARFKKAVNFGDPASPATADGDVSIGGNIAVAGTGAFAGSVDFNAGVFAKDGTVKTFGVGTNEFLVLGRRSHEYSFDPGTIAAGGTASFTLQQTSTAHTSFYVEIVAVGRVGGSSGSTSAKKVSMSFALNSNSLFASGQQTEYEKGTGSPSLAFSVAAVGSSNQVTITMTNNHTTESFSGGVIHAKISTSATALALV